MPNLTKELRETVLAAGIDLVGVTSAEPFPVVRGAYRYTQPREVLAEARAVVVAGFCVAYEPKLQSSEPGKPRGRFTPYGSRAFLQMEEHCLSVAGSFLRSKGFKAASAPRLPIKPAAIRAGLGRYGRHGVVVAPELGSWVMFACCVTDAPLAAREEPFEATDCPDGCDRCMKACPTGAIIAPFRIDKSKCITHWLWGNHAPVELREKQENRLFGCGECILACPSNARVKPRRDYPVPIDDLDDSPELIPLLRGDEAYYRRTIPSFPRRAGKNAIMGNAVIALGNIGDPAAITALVETLHHEQPRIRAYAAWALGRIGGASAREALAAALQNENEDKVKAEISRALEGLC